MKLGTEAGLDSGHTVLHGDQAPSQKRHRPQFSAHVYCGQLVSGNSTAHMWNVKRPSQT